MYHRTQIFCAFSLCLLDATGYAICRPVTFLLIFVEPDTAVGVQNLHKKFDWSKVWQQIMLDVFFVRCFWPNTLRGLPAPHCHCTPV